MTMRFRRHTAILTAAMLLATGISASVPHSLNGLAATESILDFVGKLHALPMQEKEQYSRLRLSLDSANIYRDGSSVGSSFAGFSIRGGQPMVRKADTLTAAERNTAVGAKDAGDYIPLAEAAEKIGCTFREENGDIILESPFQSATLLVLADRAFDSCGAVSDTTGYENLHVLRYETPADAYAAFKLLQNDAAVISVEPNRTLHVAEEQSDSDPNFIEVSDRWGLDAIGADEYRTWLLSAKDSLPEIVVAVIDTGIYAEHSWFKNRIKDGGTGFTMDESGSVNDGHGHGSHCAGIVCSSTPANVKILPLKAIDNRGYGESLDIYCAMEYAREMGADVVSMSLGGLGISPLIDKAAEDFEKADIPLAVAAGNESMEAKYAHPACVNSAFTVSAIEKTMDDNGKTEYILANFSNFGELIDFGAPGCDIESVDIVDPDSTTYKSGTSMATPYVAGCIADILSSDPTLSNDEIYAYLRENTTDLGEPGYDTSFGWGMVNLTDIRPGYTLVRAPKASAASGRYDGAFTVTLESATEDAAIYYTLDGTEPSAKNGILYDGQPIMIEESCTLQAIALLGSDKSSVTIRNYNVTCEPPIISVDSGAFSSPLTVFLAQDTKNSVIYYTTDGTLPSPTNGTLYDTGENDGIEITESTLLQAIAVSGKTVSEVSRAEYLLNGKDIANAFVIEDGVLKEYRGVAMFPDFTGLSFTEVGDSAFKGSSRLNGVKLPDTVTKIGASAFENCWGLSSFTAKGVTEIGEYAFSGCGALIDLKLGGLTEVPAHAFDGCDYLGHESGFDKVTVIGDYAFYRCRGLDKTDIAWSELTSIGDYAFASSFITESISLDSLKSIGKYAFDNADGIPGISLPARITALPEGCFSQMHGDHILLDLPGVTEIGDHALAVAVGDNEAVDLRLDLSKITKVGSSAFQYVHFTGSPVFSSLTEIGNGAFEAARADTFSFPALKTVKSGSLADMITNVVYLENAETVKRNAISLVSIQTASNTVYVVFGDQLKELEPGAFVNDFYGNIVLAAPENSPAAAYAAEHHMVFLTTPYTIINQAFTGEPYTSDYTKTCRQYLPDSASAYPLAFGAETVWYEIPADNPDRPVKTDLAEQNFLRLNTAEIGEYSFLAKTFIDGKEVSVSAPLHVSVIPTQFAGSLTNEDDFTLIDLKTFAENSETDTVSIAYSVKAVIDGNYMVYSAGSSIYAQFIDANGKYYGEYESVSMKKGEEYVVVITFDRYSYIPYGGFYIRPTDGSYKTMAEAIVSLDAEMIKYTGKEIIPSYDVIYKDYHYDTDSYADVLLKENQDYIVRYSNTVKPGTSEMYCFGIGDYAGCCIQSFIIYDEISEDKPVDVEIDPGVTTVYYRFVPEESGEYTFLTDFSSSFAEQFDSDGGYAFECDTTLSLRQNSWYELTYDDDSGTSGRSLLSYYLEEGEEYFIAVGSYRRTLSASLTVTRKTALPNLVYYFSGEYLDFTGEPLKTEVFLYDDDYTLTEGVDYTVSYYNNVLPGAMQLVVKGIGNYCGSIVKTDISINLSSSVDMTEINVNDPFTWSSKAECFTTYIDTTGTYSLKADDTLPFNCQVFSYNDFWEEYYNFDELNNQKDTLVLEPGKYVFVMSQDSAKKRTFCLNAVDVRPSVANAEITVSDMIYTGSPLMPEITVQLDGEKLTEDVDYIVEYPEDMTSCGSHAIMIYGINTYSGAAEVYFTIIPDDSSVTDIIETGKQTVSIETAGEMQFFHWTAKTSGLYCVASKDLRPHGIQVFDYNKQMAVNISGMDQVFAEFDAVKGKTYLIGVYFCDKTATGDLDFQLLNKYSLLAFCEIEYEDQIPLNGDLTMPEVTVTEEGRELKKGSDYVILCTGATDRYGRASFTIQGMGSYFGTIDLSYFIYPEKDQFSDQEWWELTLNEEYYNDSGYPGNVMQYRFTAPDDGTYYLSFPNYMTAGVNTFLYQNDTLLDQNTRGVQLKKGESIEAICITDWLENYFGLTGSYTAIVSDTAPTDYYYGDGMTAEINDGMAIIEYISPMSVGIYIPEEMGADGITGIFFGFGEEALYELANTHIIYCQKDGAVMQFCAEHGIPFAVMEPNSELLGDVTGDGYVNSNDYEMLLCLIGEATGMIAWDQTFINADMNSDGMIDLLDVRAIMKYVSSIAVG